MALPIVIPEICMGVALLLFFVNTGMMDAVVNMPWPLNLVEHHHRPCRLLLPLRRDRGALAPCRLQPATGGGLEGSGRQRVADLLEIIVPYMKPGLIAGALARLHAVAR